MRGVHGPGRTYCGNIEGNTQKFEKYGSLEPDYVNLWNSLCCSRPSGPLRPFWDPFLTFGSHCTLYNRQRDPCRKLYYHPCNYSMSKKPWSFYIAMYYLKMDKTFGTHSIFPFRLYILSLIPTTTGRISEKLDKCHKSRKHGKNQVSY